MSMPAVCKMCGELFDMSYDLLRTTNIEELESNLIKKRAKINLCWECRYNN